MLETRATIIQLEGRYALVQASDANGCEQCSGKGCGTGKISQLFCNNPRQFKVGNPINADVGDLVVISVADGSVLRGIGIVYLLPLMMLLIGATVGDVVPFEHGEGYVAIGAFLGLVIGFLFAKLILSHQVMDRFQPYITRQWPE